MIFPIPPRQRAGTEKLLKELTDEELKLFLDNNEQWCADVLACICSEVLRRMLEKNL